MNTIRRLEESLNFISSIISSLLWPFLYAQLSHFSGIADEFPDACALGSCTATGAERDCERQKTCLQGELTGEWKGNCNC